VLIVAIRTTRAESWRDPESSYAFSCSRTFTPHSSDSGSHMTLVSLSGLPRKHEVLIRFLLSSQEQLVHCKPACVLTDLRFDSQGLLVALNGF
jgi:hypothetical protein